MPIATACRLPWLHGAAIDEAADAGVGACGGGSVDVLWWRDRGGTETREGRRRRRGAHEGRQMRATPSGQGGGFDAGTRCKAAEAEEKR
jgi:hypothetical protein